MLPDSCAVHSHFRRRSSALAKQWLEFCSLSSISTSIRADSISDGGAPLSFSDPPSSNDKVNNAHALFHSDASPNPEAIFVFTHLAPASSKNIQNWDLD